MPEAFNWSWVQSQVAQAIGLWDQCAGLPLPDGRRYTPEEQQKRENAYDDTLRSVERELRHAHRTRAERLATQNRLIATFACFAANALDLEEPAIQLITDDFLPVGAEFARQARRFDSTLNRADLIQACRNAWTACGLQPLLGERSELTPSITGYSLLYPYTDNFLDSKDVTAGAKHCFSERFRARLRGDGISALDPREARLWALVEMIEEQYPRPYYPQVFDSLLAIHRAQEQSIVQQGGELCGDSQILQISCAKGGTSVLADACLVRGWLNEEESRFAFNWGALLQLGDDLQDLREDLGSGSLTLFSLAAALGRPLDSLVAQLLNFSEQVAAGMKPLPDGTQTLRGLLRTSWRSLIIGAIGNAHQFFSPEFLAQVEARSPFRFAFLRSRQQKLTSRKGLYTVLFDAFLEAPESNPRALPHAELRPPLLQAL